MVAVTSWNCVCILTIILHCSVCPFHLLECPLLHLVSDTAKSLHFIYMLIDHLRGILRPILNMILESQMLPRFSTHSILVYDMYQMRLLKSMRFSSQSCRFKGNKRSLFSIPLPKDFI